MRLKSIELESFRSWPQSQISLGSRLTLFVGENGSGKTAVLVIDLG
ncbi:MAG TPA: AAA family ATPase [Oligella sp.]|nr:AAA family ATPase [Oligella sp.]